MEYIVAIELLCAVQAIEFRGPEKLGKGTKIAYATIRKTISMLKEDRVLSEDIEKIRQLIKRLIIVEIDPNQARPQAAQPRLPRNS